MTFYQCSGSASVYLGLSDPHPDPLDRGTDPKIRIRYQNVTDPQHWFCKKDNVKRTLVRYLIYYTHRCTSTLNWPNILKIEGTSTQHTDTMYPTVNQISRKKTLCQSLVKIYFYKNCFLFNAFFKNVKTNKKRDLQMA